MIAVGGVVAIGLCAIGMVFKTGNIDYEFLKMLVSNLMSFAGGAGLVGIATLTSKDDNKIE